MWVAMRLKVATYKNAEVEVAPRTKVNQFIGPKVCISLKFHYYYPFAMNMKKNILLALFSAFCLAAFSQSSSNRQKPNILFILIDDMGYADLGCYGNKETQTPEIDRLAGEGIRFTQYYSSAPICSPSRVAVLTGQYPQRWEITSYIDNRKMNKERGMKDYLDLKAPSIARMFSNNGYYTAHIGKWHMGGGRDVGDAPLITEYGFDRSVTQFEGLGERYLATYETLKLKDSTRQLEKWSAQLGKGEVHWDKRYNITARFVDRAIAAMNEAQDAGKSFYINLWPDDVHTPLEPSPANRGSGSKHDLYLGVVKEMDRELGRIFDFIRKDPRLSKNTLIVLASDNGPEPGAGTAGQFRGTKGSLYEGGIREPFIVWYPGKIPAARSGSVNTKNVVVGMDLPPSFAALAGVKPDDRMDGLDMSRLFIGKSAPERKQPVMWQRPPDRKMVAGEPQPDLAIREGNFKLVADADSSGFRLYNLSEDPAEANDVSERYPEVVKRLSHKLFSWRDSVTR